MNSGEFKNIVKNTGTLGWVQFLNVLMQVLRSKVVILIIGAEGLGIYSLLISSAQLFNDLMGFGIQTVTTKSVSEANDNRRSYFRDILITLKFLAVTSGFVGAILMIVFSDFLSKFVFGNNNFKYPIIFGSILVVFNQLTFLYTGILQGLKEIKRLAYSSFVITLLNLLTAGLSLYFLKKDGIILAIILMGLSNVLVLKFYVNKTKAAIPFHFTHFINFSERFQEGYKFIKLGFLLSLSGLFANVSGNLLRVFIAKYGSIGNVGYYSASMSIINSYFGIIFTVMLSEYLPRLVSVKNDNYKSLVHIQKQISFVSILLTPILIFFSVTIPFWIDVLYSNTFLIMEDFLLFATLGVFFKGISWPMSIYLLAYGDNKLFFINETFFNVYLFFISLLMYKYYGLSGLGISYAICYFVFLFQNYFILKYKFKTTIKINVLIFFNLFLVLITIVLSLQTIINFNIFIKVLLIIISFSFSVLELQSSSKIFDTLLLRLKR